MRVQIEYNPLGVRDRYRVYVWVKGLNRCVFVTPWRFWALFHARRLARQEVEIIFDSDKSP